MDTAAQNLVGQDLPNGWRVMERIALPPNGTGGNFSVGYRVEREGQFAFLKALDFDPAFDQPDPVRTLQGMVNAFAFEEDLAFKCRDRHMSRIVSPLDSGAVTVAGAWRIPRVSYIIFEMADTNSRGYLSVVAQTDYAWRMRTLHQVATGLRQLHSNDVVHQDLKPSNVLVFDAMESKVADLGCASLRGVVSPRDGCPIPGDQSYAPPELLYDYIDPEWLIRRVGSDIYHLGSLMMFFFTGVNATHALVSRLDHQLRPTVWRDDFRVVLPHLIDAWDGLMSDFVDTVKTVTPRHADAMGVLVRQLTHPDPMERGLPDPQGRASRRFSLEKVLTRLDVLAREFELGRM